MVIEAAIARTTVTRSLSQQGNLKGRRRRRREPISSYFRSTKLAQQSSSSIHTLPWKEKEFVSILRELCEVFESLFPSFTKRADRYLVIHIYSPSTRLTLSQLWSFKIRRITFINHRKFVDLLLFRLENYERAGRALWIGPTTHILLRGV